MHAWGLRLRRARGALAISRAPQFCLPVSLTPSAPLVLPFSELTTSGYPAYMCPCPGFVAPLFGGLPGGIPTLQVRRRRRPHMARGQDGSLLLSCMTLSFTTSRRFIPTLSRPCGPRHKKRVTPNSPGQEFRSWSERRHKEGSRRVSTPPTEVRATKKEGQERRAPNSNRSGVQKLE